MNRLLFVLVAIIVPLGLVLGYALWKRNTPLRTAVPTAVAAVVTLVPEGLILLASLTFAVAALRMARRGALAQQLNAVESLASVEVICIDKTGTLTEAGSASSTWSGRRPDGSSAMLGRYAGCVADPQRDARGDPTPPPGRAEPGRQSRSRRARRWGGARLGGVVGPRRTGALRARCARPAPRKPPTRPPRPRVRDEPSRLDAERAPANGARSAPRGALRPERAQTVESSSRQGVELKVLSGDRPETVARSR